MSQLLPHIVLYTDDDFNVPEAAIFQSEDSEHAEEQMLSENSNSNVIWVVQTDDVNAAYADYHQD